MQTQSGLLTRTGTRLAAALAVLIATAGLMLAGGATPALAAVGITVTPTSGLVTTEAGGTATFTVVLDSLPTANVVIGLTSSNTSEGTVSSASLTFTTGNWSTAQTVTVTGVNDFVVDGNVPYTIITAPAVSADPNYSNLNASDVSVTNTDTTSAVQFTQTNFNVTEGNAGTSLGTFTVTRTGNLALAASVNWTATSGTAIAGTDFIAASGTLNWSAGVGGPQSGYVTINGDTTPEPDETIIITLSSPVVVTIAGSNPATLTILNDDSGGVLAFSAVTYSSNENTVATITVTRTGSTVGTVGVSYSTSNGSATAGLDYNTAAGTLSFGPSVASLTFTVTILNDFIAESTETVGLTLSTPTGGASLGAPSTATLNILDGSANLPVVSVLTPAFGPITGGNLVTITGINLSGASQVAFGSAIAYPTSFSATQVTVVAPTSSTFGAQMVEVVVTTPAGPSSTAGTANDYTYTNGPTVTAVSPATGPASGLTFVTITGTGFTPTGMTVTFGGTTAVFSYVSATSISAVSPAHIAGVVDVIVTVAFVPSPNTFADDFTYTGTSVPTVTSINPTSGPVGTTVTVTGTGFTGATSVTVGGVAAAFTVVSDSSITLTIPTGTPSGLVSIRITTPSGLSLDVVANNFTNTTTNGVTTTYTLYFRWSLIAWNGIDNISASNAVKGIETGTANPATNDVSGSVTAIWYFDGPSQVFKGYFVGFDNTPGANDFTTLRRGTSYWIAISTSGSVTWTVLQGP